MHIPSLKKIEAQARGLALASYKIDPMWRVRYDSAYATNEVLKPAWDKVMAACEGGDKCKCREHPLHAVIVQAANRLNTLYYENSRRLALRVIEWRKVLLAAREAKLRVKTKKLLATFGGKSV